MSIELWRTRPFTTANAPLRQWADRIFYDAFARKNGNGSAGFADCPIARLPEPDC
jgi:hypothetical protein